MREAAVMLRKLALFIIGLAITSMAAAYSHSAFVSGTPGKNAVIEEIPNEIRLQFNEDLLLVGEENPNRVELFNPKNVLISGESSAAGPFVFAPILNREPIPGDYVVNYRIASADGHIVSGTYKFKLAGAVEEEAKPEASSDPQIINEEPVTTGELSQQEIVQEDSHHDNFFIHHLEHIIWVLLALSFIGLWALLRFRK